MILRWNKITLPPTSTWTRGLNKIFLLPMSTWIRGLNQMLLTQARPPAVPELLKMSAQATRAPAQRKEKPQKYQKSGLTRHLLLQDKLRRPRRNNQRPRLQLLKRLLSQPSPALSR
jgi:hypothetical protein